MHKLKEKRQRKPLSTNPRLERIHSSCSPVLSKEASRAAVHSSVSLWTPAFSFLILLEPCSLRGTGNCRWVVMTEMERLEAFSEVSKCIRCNYYVMSWNFNSSQHIHPNELDPQGRRLALVPMIQPLLKTFRECVSLWKLSSNLQYILLNCLDDGKSGSFESECWLICNR